MWICSRQSRAPDGLFGFADEITTKSRGSGVGLPTAKRLIEAHRGNITVACPAAGGTIVTVELPAAGAAAVI
jgi:nitrogen-specific signal transduction histidine kinase